MSIKCKINTYKETEVFNAGDLVSGIINYEIEEEAAFNKITVSLKGNGYLIVKNKQKGDNVYTRRRRESYVDVDYIIYKNDNGEKLKGLYEKEFNFVLPNELPSTMRLMKKSSTHHIYCHAIYYIRIKFQEAGIVSKLLKFQKLIRVNSIVKPRLPSEPTTYGDQRVLSQFSWKRNILSLNATIDKSVRMPGDKIKIDFEIVNDTNFNINGVIVQLMESYTFKASRQKVIITEDVKNTDSRSGFILHGDTKNRNAEITVPKSLSSIEHSKLISREYFIIITIELPKHRKDVTFKIPIQITNDRPPPAYWEVLQETNEQIDQYFDDYNFVDDDFANDEDIETSSL